MNSPKLRRRPGTPNSHLIEPPLRFLAVVDGERLVNRKIYFEVGTTPGLIRVPKLDLDYFEE